MSIQHALLALSVTSALNYGVDVQSAPTLSRTITKTSGIALLAALTVLIDGPRQLVAALGFGALGDAFLAWDDSDQNFLCGLGSFLVAHIFYVILFAKRSGGSQFDLTSALTILAKDTWRGATTIVLILVAITMIAVLVPRVQHELRVPIGVYTTVIAIMVTMALTINDARVVAGALMFAFSDSLLAIERFLLPRSSVYRTGILYAVWGLYYGGQLSIMLGVTEFSWKWW